MPPTPWYSWSNALRRLSLGLISATVASTGLAQAPSSLPTGIEHHGYRCESGAVLTSAYDPEADRLWVRYRDEVLELKPVRSGSGAKFGGQGVPWGWWSKGTEGLVFAYSADGMEGEILDRCNAEEISGGGTAVSAPQRQWSLAQHADVIALLDCADCGDDIGVMLQCQERGKPALLRLFWAAVDAEEPSAGPIQLEVGGKVFRRLAETSYFGQLGQVPQLRIGPDDRLLRALQDGGELRVLFESVDVQIGLRGFQSAFQQFDATCPWHPEQATTSDEGAPAFDDRTAVEPAPAPVWMIHELDDPAGGAPLVSLAFGIPETDAIAFQATCSAQRGLAAPIDVVVLVDPGDRAEGEAADLVIAAGQIEHRIPGKISTGYETYPGIRIGVDARHPLWQTLQGREPISLHAGEGPPLILPVSSSRAKIDRFLAACSPPHR